MVLFLTNNNCTLPLFDWLSARENVCLLSGPLTIDQVNELKPMWIVSYNYIHIIQDKVIDIMDGRIINLHISYLPWNRGSSPNIWSFIDNTPKGVSIHQVSAGLDKGKILYQKECCFDVEKETFVSTYMKLNDTIMKLFMDNWEDIKRGNYVLKEQVGKGSYHSMKHLDELKKMVPFEWGDNISEFLQRYKLLSGI